MKQRRELEDRMKTMKAAAKAKAKTKSKAKSDDGSMTEAEKKYKRLA